MPPEALRKFLSEQSFSQDEILSKTARIHGDLIAASPYVDRGNFTRIHSQDLRFLFDAYDAFFFQGECRRALGDGKLRFRISRRMTSSGGHTARYNPRQGTAKPWYEIAVSSTLLFQAFSDSTQRSIVVSGRVCHDRLDALQRIMEHEIVHLLETLCWSESSCSGARFQSIALRFFGHTEHKHRLVTPREHAFVKFQVRAGSRVQFRIDNHTYTGIVNRVTKRATVLVPDPKGLLYSDGQRYVKYYVPVGMLEVIGDNGPSKSS